MDTTEIVERCKNFIQQFKRYIILNKVQLCGLQKHCSLFTLGHSWLVDCHISDAETAMIALERRFLRDPVTHVVIREFLHASKMRIMRYPVRHLDDGTDGILLARMHDEKDIHIKFQFHFGDTYRNVIVVSVVTCVDTSQAWLFYANGKKHYTTIRTKKHLQQAFQEKMFDCPTLVRLHPHVSLIDRCTDNGMQRDFTREEMEAALYLILHQEKICAGCGAHAKRVCLNCHMTRFCTQECQHRAWPEHKKICSIIETVADGLAKIANGCKMVPNE